MGLEVLVSTRIAMELAVVTFVKASVILLGAGAAARWLSSASASARSRLWSGTLVAVLALPVASLGMPRWRSVLGEPWRYPAETPLVGVEAVETRPREFGASRARTGTDTDTATGGDDVPASLPPASLALLAWWLGVVVLGTGMVTDLARARILVSRCRRVPDNHPLSRLLARERVHLGIRREVRVLLSEEAGLAAIVGTVHPAVLLGPDVAALPVEELRPVLVHELAHVQRHDVVAHLAARLAAVLLWPNPLVWWARRRAADERERACDDAVINRGIESPAYARVLLAFAAHTHAPGHAMRGPVGSRFSATRGRLDAVLDPLLDRRPGRARAAVPALAFFVIVGGSIGSLDLVGPVPGTGATPDLIESLAHDDPEVRARAARTLGRRGPAPARAQLEALLDDSSADVRLAAIGALEQLADAASLDAMAHVLERPYDGGRGEHGFVLKLAILTLGKIDSPQARRVLEDQLDRPVAPLRWLALERILGQPGQREAAIEHLRTFATSDPSERNRRLAREALESFR